jgi:lipopolysaccharide transport system ATP-binding protein
LSNDVAIQVEGLSKQYRIGETKERHKTLRDTLTNSVGAPFRRVRSTLKRTSLNRAGKFWALKDISFEVKQGEVVGIIGNNGAGKSTLLKILSRITEPTSGYADIHGRVGSLLEVGSGFHPELTGRENVYLNGAILGMRRDEIKRRFDEIVSFAGVENFIDTPVKRYSSGMGLRLAFSVAAHLEPEILLVDEVLAVGDATFQKRCMGKMGEVAHQGRTVILVSHNLAAITRLCTRTILLEQGLVTSMGPSQSVVSTYIENSMENASQLQIQDNPSNDFRVTNVAIVDQSGEPRPVVMTGQELRLKIKYETSFGKTIPNAILILTFTDGNGTPLFVCCSLQSCVDSLSLPTHGTLCFSVPRLPLLPGRYLIGFMCKVGKTVIAEHQNFMNLEVAMGDFFGTGKLPNSRAGSVIIDHEWSVIAPENQTSRVSSEYAPPHAAPWGGGF